MPDLISATASFVLILSLVMGSPIVGRSGRHGLIRDCQIRREFSRNALKPEKAERISSEVRHFLTETQSISVHLWMK
jgi:hypothetical protein